MVSPVFSRIFSGQEIYLIRDNLVTMASTVSGSVFHNFFLKSSLWESHANISPNK